MALTPRPPRLFTGANPWHWRLGVGLALLPLLGSGCRPSESSPPPSAAADRYRCPERLVAALDLAPGNAVAEIGAGGGYLTLRLARAVAPGGRVVATDIDPEALATLRIRVRRAGLEGLVETRRVRPDEPGLGQERFDLILLAQVDHLLPDRRVYLRALVPSLRPWGRIAISNGERHLAAVEDAAQAAGLRAHRPPVDLPAQFLLLLFPEQS